MSHGFIVALGVRVLLVLPFLPFSALDKVLNFRAAVAQAHEAVASEWLASALIIVGLAVEIVMPLGILTGIADRLAAFVLAGYCCVTALLWKQFWATGDFWAGPQSRGRTLLWDFLKNLSLAGGFLLLTFGPTGAAVPAFPANPFASSQPYTAGTDGR